MAHKKPIKDQKTKTSSANTQKISKDKNDGFQFNIKERKSQVLLVLLAVAVVYVINWMSKPGVVVQDPWYEAVMMVDSSTREKDPVIKQRLKNEGGRMLKELVKKHPYHARVHFFLGYYYMLNADWDSCIAQQKEAYKLDSGSTINSVWGDASNMLITATLNKVNLLLSEKREEEAKNLVLSNIRYNIYNPDANKYLGNYYLTRNQTDSTLYYYNNALATKPDADLLNNMGVIYLKENKVKEALPYFQKALEVNPAHQSAKANLDNATAHLKSIGAN